MILTSQEPSKVNLIEQITAYYLQTTPATLAKENGGEWREHRYISMSVSVTKNNAFWDCKNGSTSGKSKDNSVTAQRGFSEQHSSVCIQINILN